MLKVYILISLAVLSINDVIGAPRPNPDNVNSELLEKSFSEYLRHDPELVRKLEELEALADAADAHQRVKRQEIDEGTVDVDLGEPDKGPGFFDRAAKFVVELLQRFLRWINTDGS